MFICTYCGEHADCYDHTIPVAYRHNTRKGFENRTYAVPSCTECNTTLGAAPIFTVNGRADYILKNYLIKYKKLASCAEWEEDELDEMSADFRRTIRATMKQKETFTKRVLWLKGMASESNNMTWEDAQQEFSSKRDAIHSAVIRDMKRANGLGMKPRRVLAADVSSEHIYNKEKFKEIVKQHFKGVGYKVDAAWFSSFDFYD